MINLVVLHGVLARPAALVELPSGSRLAGFEVTVRRPDGPAEPVPVTWADPPGWAAELDAGVAVMVLGRVRRRFFRSGGATQSRTEVVAARLVRVTAPRRVTALLDEAIRCLEEAGDIHRSGR